MRRRLLRSALVYYRIVIARNRREEMPNSVLGVSADCMPARYFDVLALAISVVVKSGNDAHRNHANVEIMRRGIVEIPSESVNQIKIRNIMLLGKSVMRSQVVSGVLLIDNSYVCKISLIALVASK